MKVSPSTSWVLASTALVLGAGIGVWQAQRDFKTERFVPFNPVSSASTDSDGKVQHIIVVNGDTHEFGMLQRGTKMSHEFILQNVSDHPIEIWVGGSSCKCTVAKLGGSSTEGPVATTDDPLSLTEDGDELPMDFGGDTDDRLTVQPGETTNVTLQWEGHTSTPQFEQTAEILTNEPQQPAVELKVVGYVRDLVDVRPEAIQMNNVSVEKGATTAAFVYCVEPEFPEVESLEFVVEDTKVMFEATLEPVKDLDEPDYQSAKRLVIRAKPGLPVGTVSQKLRLNLKSDGRSSIFVAITAKVDSELTILGGGDYYARSGVVRWGVVDREAGRETTLYVLVKGGAKEQVKLEPVEIDPADCLEVEVLPVKNREAVTWTIPVKVRLKPDAPPTSRLGGADSEYGMVRLSTGHAVAKELQFRVQFAVN